MTHSNIPEGFTPIDAEAETRPAVEMLDYEVFQGNGAKVLYGGIVDLAPGRERSDVHTFRGHTEPDGMVYGLWRCASLDLQLRRIPAGTLLFLHYHGKQHNAEKGFDEHKWTVARPAAQAATAPARGDKRRRPASFD